VASFQQRDDRPRVGISRCLLGDEVRYDGGHKRDRWLVETFGPYVQWVSVCPEVEVGMGTPREPIHLVAARDGVPSGEHRVRLLGVNTQHDWTRAMDRWRRTRIRELANANLSGYILKKDSPSCGPDGVRVDVGASVTRTGRGLFAQALIDACPNLPVEDEGRLQDPEARDQFVERLFAYQRVRRFFAARWTRGDLVAFHAAHKLLLLAHSRQAYTTLGRLVARAADLTPREVATLYERAFMDALRTPTTPGRHADVLQHMLGHVTDRLDDTSRHELLSAIEGYRTGVVPLMVPLTLMRHHVRLHDIEYLASQVYLHPAPGESSLRGEGRPARRAAGGQAARSEGARRSSRG
jgi:uncharacterized protein YbgA (DUF1722 family)/uncharacterized protein YbbK (DUF523 family)